MAGGGYTVRKFRLAALAPLLAVPAFLLAVRELDLPDFALPALVFFAAISLYQAWQRSLVLRVNADGVRVGRGVEYEYGHQRLAGAVVPWTSIRDVVVVSPMALAAGGDPQVGVRLKTGAPLPAGARAVIHDPDDPDAAYPALSASVPAGRFDRGKLTDAVARFGAGPAWSTLTAPEHPAYHLSGWTPPAAPSACSSSRTTRRSRRSCSARCAWRATRSSSPATACRASRRRTRSCPT